MKYYSTWLCRLCMSGLVWLALIQQGYSQSSEEKAVRKAVETMFEGMRKGDSSMVSSVFVRNPIMHTVGQKDGTPVLFTGSLERFLHAVGTPHDKVWDERIGNLKIHIDGRLATAWMDFSFYAGESFSHCGVNTMTLFKDEDGWKIAYIADTRRKKDCGLGDN